MQRNGAALLMVMSLAVLGGGCDSTSSNPAKDSGVGVDAGHDAGFVPAADASSSDHAVASVDGARPDSSTAAADSSAPDSAASDSNSGFDAGTPSELPPPLVLLHLSDIHFGSGSFAIPAFELMLAEIVPALDPLVTFATGDLVETGNNEESWTDYRDHVDGSTFTHLSYIEIPGNHDIYLDLDLSNYLDNTLAGRNGHGTYGLYHHDTAWGRLRVVALDTCSSGDPLRDSTGYLAPAQVDELIADMATEVEPVAITIALGHHPADIDGLGLFNTDDDLMRLLDAADAAAYLFGHRHGHLLSWDSGHLFAMARTLGNPSDEQSSNRAGFNIVIWDDGLAVKGVAIDETDTSVAWPVVVISRPASAVMGFNNPMATPQPRGASDNLLRALVFAPTGLPELVQYRIDAGTWQSMQRVGDHYEARFVTPDAERCEIEVQATLQQGVGTDVIEVELF